MATKLKSFNQQNTRKDSCSKAPPEANVLAAVNHIQNLFESKRFTYAIFGSLEMLCLGHRLELNDVHIAYDDRDFQRIKSKLDSDQRVRLPDGMNSLFPAKIVIRTGPFYKDKGCAQSEDIDVYLVPPGSHGTPPNDSLMSNTVLLNLNNENKPRTYKCLNMLYLLRTLLRYCGVRGLACDPSKHMVFLCQHYSRDVQAVRTQLDQNFVQKNFLATPFCQRLSAEDQRVCYRALLNTEPPPNTAKILPTVQTGHKYSFSASGAATGTRSVSQKSSPSLVTQASCELLNLPHHIAAIPPREQGTEGKNQLWDISVTHEQTPSTASELPATHLDARSRYRPISVPTRNIHSTSIQLKTCKSSELRLLHTEAALPIRTWQAQDAQNASHYQQHPVSHLTSAPQMRRSMPNLGAGVGARISSPVLHELPQSIVQKQRTYIMPVELSVTPVPYNPGQEHTRSQVGFTGIHEIRLQPADTIAISERPTVLNATLSNREAVPLIAELSATPVMKLHTNQQHLAGPWDASTYSHHILTPEEPLGNLRLVEASGLHHLLEKPHPEDNPIQTNTPKSPPATAHLDPLSQFIAELSAHTPSTHPDPLPEHESPTRATHHLYAPSIPASLQAGGSATHNAPLHPSPPAQISINAAKYTAYTTSSSSPPAVSAYKPYRPPALTLSPLVIPGSIPGSPPKIPDEPETAFSDDFSAVSDGNVMRSYFDTPVARSREGSQSSFDSRVLALEYRAALPEFDGGYASW